MMTDDFEVLGFHGVRRKKTAPAYEGEDDFNEPYRQFLQAIIDSPDGRGSVAVQTDTIDELKKHLMQAANDLEIGIRIQVGELEEILEENWSWLGITILWRKQLG